MQSDVEVKHGRDAVKEVYEALTQTDWYYSLYSSDAVTGEWGEYSNELGKRIASANVKAKELIGGTRPVLYAELFKKPDQEVRYLPNGTRINSDLVLYEGTLVLISYEGEPKTVIIKEKGIFETAKMMFELLWESTPEFIDVKTLLGDE